MAGAPRSRRRVEDGRAIPDSQSHRIAYSVDDRPGAPLAEVRDFEPEVRYTSTTALVALASSQRGFESPGAYVGWWQPPSALRFKGRRSLGEASTVPPGEPRSGPLPVEAREATADFDGPGRVALDGSLWVASEDSASVPLLPRRGNGKEAPPSSPAALSWNPNADAARAPRGSAPSGPRPVLSSRRAEETVGHTCGPQIPASLTCHVAIPRGSLGGPSDKTHDTGDCAAWKDLHP